MIINWFRLAWFGVDVFRGSYEGMVFLVVMVKDDAGSTDDVVKLCSPVSTSDITPTTPKN
jgi:hypothetical protein